MTLFNKIIIATNKVQRLDAEDLIEGIKDIGY